MDINKRKLIIAAIVLFALTVRLAGIDYGLPFMLIHDEPPFIFGALKMLETKTFIPALNSSVFESALYYPPYLSYLYLPFFAAAVAAKFLFGTTDIGLLKNLLIADPSTFFIIARVISAVLGAVTVYLVYVIGRRLFGVRAGLLAALFLSLSFIHTLFSHFGRHWVAVTFVFILALWILSKSEWSEKRRHICAAVILGLGVGVNYQVAVAALIIPLWAVLRDRASIKKLILPGVLFIALGLLAYVLYPAGLPVRGSDVINTSKSIAGFFSGYEFHFTNLFLNDTVLAIFALAGLYFAFKSSRKLFYVLLYFIIFYIAAFYILLFHVDRYVIMLLPIFALFAGYGAARLMALSSRFARVAWLIVFVIALAYSATRVGQFDYLLLKNDTRVQAIEWIRENASPQSKLIVAGESLRIPSIPAAQQEQKAIDPLSLRSVDKAESELDSSANYHALNLYTVHNREFFDSIADYTQRKGYQYLVLDEEFVSRKGLESLNSLGYLVTKFEGYADRSGDLANWFGGGQNARETIPRFMRNPLEIFRTKNLGPAIFIRKM